MKIKNSCIFLNGLRFHAFHGVMPQERLTGNDYRVDLKIDFPLETAVGSDNVDDTLNYATVYTALKEEMDVPSQLIERVAYRIADRLFRTFKAINEVEIKVEKCNPPMGADCEGAGVKLHLINDKTE
ncbi:dihydroneopterin aldolase [Segatella maculosa]|uniref:7,8-dihydroneopterin aldolase n=1 Tax=Segatella maculosa OT 289 TaxID=999422 RepID=H1HMB4_9BACT|nr:dihydroneopterin aldolase [Segatella maculosa]EHO70749.1 dihydroneopterin aldolase [Segatella maculosa OT 289]